MDGDVEVDSASCAAGNSTGNDASSATHCSGDESGVSATTVVSVGTFCETFARFETYDFDGDKKFQNGLEKIVNLPDWRKTSDHSKDLLRIKAFYYAK
jgi:hypothetical protein